MLFIRGMSNIAKPSYPTVTDSSLVPFRALELQMKQYPDLLTREDCPYPPSVKTFLAKVLNPQGVRELPVESGNTSMSDEDLESEIVLLYRDLQKASSQITGIDPKDKAAFLKTTSDLLTKMVALRERQMNVRQMGKFQKTVVELLEGVMTPAQRTEFVEKMGQHVDLQG